MKLLVNYIKDNRDTGEILKTTETCDCDIKISNKSLLKIGVDEIDLKKLDFICIDDNSYTNRDFENIYKDLYEMLRETMKKNGMLNIIGETRIFKSMEYKSLMIYTYNI